VEWISLVGAQYCCPRRAGVAIGADRLIVQVHPAAETVFSVSAQSMDLVQFQKMMKDLEPYVRLWNESRKAQAVATVNG